MGPWLVPLMSNAGNNNDSRTFVPFDLDLGISLQLRGRVGSLKVHHIVPLPHSYKVKKAKKVIKVKKANLHLQSPSAPSLTLVAEPQTVALRFFHDPHKTLLFQLKMEWLRIR